MSVWDDLYNWFHPKPKPPTPTPIPTVPPGTAIPTPGALLWSDDFDGAAGQGCDSATWWNQTGRYGASSGEDQFYTDGSANAALDGASNVVITAARGATPDNKPAPNNFTSARIVTLDKKTFSPPCRISIRAKVPYTMGLLPAIWTMGQDAAHYEDWPRNGEIDVMEMPGLKNDPDGPKRLSMNLHGPAASSPNTHKNIGTQWISDVPLTDDFHIFGIDWHADRIEWHLDGILRATMTKADFEKVGGSWVPFSGSIPHYLMLNVAVGNNWTGDPDSTSSFPQSMLVDYVKVWQL